jgi:hypothetical protein
MRTFETHTTGPLRAAINYTLGSHLLLDVSTGGSEKTQTDPASRLAMHHEQAAGRVVD